MRKQVERLKLLLRLRKKKEPPPPSEPSLRRASIRSSSFSSLRDAKEPEPPSDPMGQGCGCCQEDPSVSLIGEKGSSQESEQLYCGKKDGITQDGITADKVDDQVFAGVQSGASNDSIEFSSSRRKGRERKGDRIGRRNSAGGRRASLGSFSSGDNGTEEHLAKHRKPRAKGMETKKFIMNAMKQDRVCAMLGEQEIMTILDTMEYFEFGANDYVVKQGDSGTTFFVTHEGTMEVCVNGRVVNTMQRGRGFGGLALLYNCPRTASVTATTACSAWGANGETFHKVLQENAKKSYAENRAFVDKIRLFDGLAPKQKDRVSEACFIEVFEPGSRVVTEGEASTAMYFVKTSELRLYENAVIDENGKVTEGDAVGFVKPGECIGEQALLRDEQQTQTAVVAGDRCEVLVISGEGLKEVFGKDLRSTFEHVFVEHGIKLSELLSQFTVPQQTAMAEAVVVKDYKSGEKLPKGLRHVLVCEGVVTGKLDDVPVTLGRGSCWERDTLIERSVAAVTKKSIRMSRAASRVVDPSQKVKNQLSDLQVGSAGARIGVLTEDVLRLTMKKLGLHLQDDNAAAEYTRKMLLAKKVRIFRHLAQEALHKLVEGFVLMKFKKGEFVIKQGEMGDKFFVIASGEVGVSIGDKFIRTMPRNQFFGERALLFDEPRTASVQVSTSEAELWSVDKTLFKNSITAKMQEELTQKIRLQDTSVTMKDLQQVGVIGEGACGVVRLVEHKKNQTRYALKRVHKVDGLIPAEVTRECELLAENDHPFIMTLVKTFETASDVYMLTELISGGELHSAIRRIPTVLSRASCQFYAGSIVLVLEELAERNIVYRDMKPENVMLDQQGYLKLIDFGVAKKIEEGKSKTFTVIGTPHYMAPEVMRGHGYGTEVDIWSLGVMMFEFVCGALPFGDDADDPGDVCGAVLKDPITFPAGFKDELGKKSDPGPPLSISEEAPGLWLARLRGHQDP